MEKVNQEKAEEKQLYQKMVGDMANIKNVPEQDTLVRVIHYPCYEVGGGRHYFLFQGCLHQMGYTIHW